MPTSALRIVPGKGPMWASAPTNEIDKSELISNKVIVC